jgi:hypothetical protein
MRLGSDDLNPAGTQFDDALAAVAMMKDHGLDLADLSIGFNTDDMDPKPFADLAFMVERAARVRREVGIPIRSRWCPRTGAGGCGISAPTPTASAGRRRRQPLAHPRAPEPAGSAQPDLSASAARASRGYGSSVPRSPPVARLGRGRTGPVPLPRAWSQGFGGRFIWQDVGCALT